MTTNPLVVETDKEKLIRILGDLRDGEIKVRSNIELAIIDDIKEEVRTKVPTKRHQE